MSIINEGSCCYYCVPITGVALMEINNPPMNALIPLGMMPMGSR